MLHDQGYDRLTQPQVARAAGITQGHLTYYFPTRAALLLAVAEHSLRGGMRQMTHAGNGHHDLEAAIELIRQALLEKQRTRTILGLMIASDRHREIKKPLRDMILPRARDGFGGPAATGRRADSNWRLCCTPASWAWPL